MKIWFQENKERLVVFFGILLIGSLCFEAGLLQGKMKQVAPLILSLPAEPEKNLQIKESAIGATASPSSRIDPAVAMVNEKTTCVFVGSKNSNKYHLATCPVAKRIKPENKICFSSKEEAEKRGYIPSCLK